MYTIAWIGFSQSLFAAILLLAKKNNSTSDKVLSAWLILLSFDFLSCALNYEVFGKPLLSSPFLLFNPALYLYIRSLTLPAFKLKWIQILHLVPFLGFEIYAYSIKQSFSLDTLFLNDQHFTFRMVFSAATIVSWMIYNPLSLILVHQHRIQLKNEFSNIEKNENLSWVLVVTIFYVVYCIVAFLITVLAYFAQMNPLTPHFYNYITLLVFIYVISFYGLSQLELSRKVLLPLVTVPYKNSTLSKQIKQEIRQRIMHYFEVERSYLNSDLNMELLSEELKIPKHQITEVLNTEIGKSFFQFVNFYRVEAVKAMLSDSQNKYSIEAIGYECGFSSKSSFYTVFKNLTGETPVSYRNSILN